MATIKRKKRTVNKPPKERRIEGNGYIVLYRPDHLRARKSGYVYEHIIIAEEILGRSLVPGEVVHHKNFKRGDNRSENLEVLTKRRHFEIHQIKQWEFQAERDETGLFCGELEFPLRIIRGGITN